MKEIIYTTIPIIFKDINFIRATRLSENDAVKMWIAMQKGIRGMTNFKANARSNTTSSTSSTSSIAFTLII